MIKGIVTVTKTNLETGEVQSWEGENTVVKRTVEEVLMNNNGVFDDAKRIAISTDILSPDYKQITLDNVIAIGSTVDVAGRTFVDRVGSIPSYVTYQNRFTPPAAARTFSTIAVCTGTTNNNLSNVTVDIWAYLTFAEPYSQTTTDQFDVTYKLYWDWTEDCVNFSEQFQRETEYLLLDEIGGFDLNDNGIITTLYSDQNPDLYMRSPNLVTIGSEFSATETKRTDLLKIEYDVNVSFPTNRYIGGLGYGRLERIVSGASPYKALGGVAEFPSSSNLSGVFPHNEITDALWEDIGNKPNSNWKPTITEATFQEDLPAIYSLRVSQSGGEGVGAYEVYRTIYSGGNYNSTDETWNLAPNAFIGTQKYPGFDTEDDIPFDERFWYAWKDDLHWVSARGTTVAIWQIYPDFIESQTFDLAALNSVTQINDIATLPDQDKILVATHEGLIEIDTILETTTVLNSDRARAVGVGYSDAIFAVLINGSDVGRLASSLNASWNDAHSFSGTIDYDRVLFIRIDRDSTDYNMGILEWAVHDLDVVGGTYENRNDQAIAKIHWWNNASNYLSTLEIQSKANTNVYYHPCNTFPHNSSFIVEEGVWIYPKYFSSENSSFAIVGGYSEKEIAQLVVHQPTYINPDGTILSGTNRYPHPARFQIGAAIFNQEIRSSTYHSTTQDLHFISKASFALLEKDLSNDVLSVIVAGRNYTTTINGSYDESTHKIYGSGAIDLTVSLSDSTVYQWGHYKGEAQEYESLYTTNDSVYVAQTLALCGNVAKLKRGGFVVAKSPGIASAAQPYAGYHLASGTRFLPVLVSLWGAYSKTALYDYRGWGERYGWDSVGSQWVLDPDQTYGGKPLHTAQEPLIDGLEISWGLADANPAIDLIVDQHYEFSRCSKGIISNGKYLPQNIKFSYVFRPTVELTISETIPASPYQITLPEATSDPLWLTLDDSDESPFNLAIAGYNEPATIIFSGTPQINEVLIQNPLTGVLEFNSADEGKALTGAIVYYQKIHSTEVL